MGNFNAIVSFLSIAGNELYTNANDPEKTRNIRTNEMIATFIESSFLGVYVVTAPPSKTVSEFDSEILGFGVWSSYSRYTLKLTPIWYFVLDLATTN